MTPPRILALDLSLNATGVAVGDTLITLTSGMTGVKRLGWYRQRIGDLVGHGVSVDLAVIEGHAFSSRNSQTHALGELSGIVHLTLADCGIPVVEVTPASLKVYATGKGNASKAEVLTAAVRRLGYEGHDDNQADAGFLRAMALDHYGFPLVELPATHRRALVKVDWPDFTPLDVAS